jgi:hypothetical protein
MVNYGDGNYISTGAVLETPRLLDDPEKITLGALEFKLPKTLLGWALLGGAGFLAYKLVAGRRRQNARRCGRSRHG